MEAWLAELEMEVDRVTPLINNSYNQCHHQSDSSMISTPFGEQLAATLGEDFPYLFSAESNSNSPQWDIDSILVDQVTSPPLQLSNNNNDNEKIVSCNNVKESQQIKNNKEESNGSTKQALSGGAKRKRQPSQVQDHILAERKRRELLSQLFISLSALVPGLKKMDKTSVLGEAIKYMKQLQENVKVLEEVVAKRTVESMIVVKKSQLIVDYDGSDDNDSSSTVDDSNCGSGHGGAGHGGADGGSSCDVDGGASDSLPEIEVKISGKSLLLKVYCANHKWILAKLFAELVKYDLSVTNSSVVSFGSLSLDITIVAQIEGEFNKNVRNFVRTLRSALLCSSPKPCIE